MMLTESVAVALQPGESRKVLNSTLKDAGIVLHQIHPEPTVVQVFKKSSTPINGLAISKTHIFAVQTDKAAVNVFNREKGNQEASIFFPEKITSIAIQDSDTANIAVLGMANGGLVIWEVLTGRTIMTNRYHTQAVSTVRVHKNSNLVLTGSADSNVQVWDLAKMVSFSSQTEQAAKSPLRAFTQHRSAIADVILSHGHAFSVAAISAGKDGTCHIWDPNTAQLSRTILLNSVPKSLALDPVDRVLYVGSEEGTVNSVDFIRTFIPLAKKQDRATNGSTIEEQTFPFARLPEGAGAVNCLTVSYDSTVLVTGHSDGKLYAWDVAKGKLKQTIMDIGQPITNVLALTPEPLRKASTSSIMTPAIVKPKPAETFAAGNDHGTSGIPANYTIHVQLTGKLGSSRSVNSNMTDSSMPSHEYETRLRNPGFFTDGPFDQSLIDDGLSELSDSVFSSASTAVERD